MTSKLAIDLDDRAMDQINARCDPYFSGPQVPSGGPLAVMLHRASVVSCRMPTAG